MKFLKLLLTLITVVCDVGSPYGYMSSEMLTYPLYMIGYARMRIVFEEHNVPAYLNLWTFIYSPQSVARVLIFNCTGERDARKLLAPLVVRFL